MNIVLSGNQKAAIDRLMADAVVDIALSDTGQSRKTAAFLLAWWNAGEWGGFDPPTQWGVDAEIASDIVTVFAAVANTRYYPDSALSPPGARH